jgi:hypothetical protein
MPKRVTPEQREKVLRLLTQGLDRDTIAAAVGVTPGQVSAISAHVSMGTFRLSTPEGQVESEGGVAVEMPGQTSDLNQTLKGPDGDHGRKSKLAPVAVGFVAESEEIRWNLIHGSDSAEAYVLTTGK